MARGRQTRRIPDWMIGLVITCVMLGLAWVRPAFLESIEYQTFDLRLKWFGSRAPAQNIAIVAIDEESITKLGRWPWPRSRIATPVDRLAAQGAKVMAQTDTGRMGMPRPAGPSSSLNAATAVGQRTTLPGSAATRRLDA